MNHFGPIELFNCFALFRMVIHSALDFRIKIALKRQFVNNNNGFTNNNVIVVIGAQ